MCVHVANVVHAQDGTFRELPLDADVHLEGTGRAVVGREHLDAIEVVRMFRCPDEVGVGPRAACYNRSLICLLVSNDLSSRSPDGLTAVRNGVAVVYAGNRSGRAAAEARRRLSREQSCR